MGACWPDLFAKVRARRHAFEQSSANLLAAGAAAAAIGLNPCGMRANRPETDVLVTAPPLLLQPSDVGRIARAGRGKAPDHLDRSFDQTWAK